MAEPRVALRSRRRASIVVALLGAALVLIAGGGRTSGRLELTSSKRSASAKRASGYHFRRVERCFMRKINHRRERRSLRPLQWDKQIAYVARRHARKMAKAGSISHDRGLTSKVTHWRSLGQNSGTGRHCRQLFKAFWNSPGHRSNILGRWRFQGVGTRWRNGHLYVQQVFEFRSNPGNVYGWP
ncbi:MAG: CAP domain-containing protein [Actinomycetota bacterium]